jgi:hypothetical protein
LGKVRAVCNAVGQLLDTTTVLSTENISALAFICTINMSKLIGSGIWEPSITKLSPQSSIIGNRPMNNIIPKKVPSLVPLTQIQPFFSFPHKYQTILKTGQFTFYLFNEIKNRFCRVENNATFAE